MKKKVEPPENAERWMVSYADFLTLLFAVFVVLYSFAMAKASEAQAMVESVAAAFSDSSMISSSGGALLVPGSLAQELNQEASAASQVAQISTTDGKTPVESGGMVMNFMSSTTTSAPTVNENDENSSGSDTEQDGMNIGDSSTSSGDLIVSESNQSDTSPRSSKDPNGGSDSGQGGFTSGGKSDMIADGGRTSVDTESTGEGQFGHPFDAIKKSVSDTLSEVGMEKEIEMEQDEHWLTLNISSGFLFAEGSASVMAPARPLIAKIAIVLSSINNFVRVRGYTDDRFVGDGIFRNSWDLSAQRAVSVLNELEADGIDPKRLAIEAYGAYAPFYSNITAAGRAQNRRVVIAISRYAMTQHDVRTVDDEDEIQMNNESGYDQRAGSGNLGITVGEDNTIRLQFGK